jgi:hypothetical protein
MSRADAVRSIGLGATGFADDYDYDGDGNIVHVLDCWSPTNWDSVEIRNGRRIIH